MTRESPAAIVSNLCRGTHSVFRGRDALQEGVTREQLRNLRERGVIVREFRDTYRMSAVAQSPEQRLQAALLWAGDGAAASGRSAAAVYGLEGIRMPSVPEIVVPRARRPRSDAAVVRRPTDVRALMIREHKGLRVTGIEATLVVLAAVLTDEELEIACEDARRRHLTTIAALQAYLQRFGASGRNGTGKLRRLLRELDPKHPSRSTLEVKTRRLLAANGLPDFVREFPLMWDGVIHHFDFAFTKHATILETNGRRWHDDPNDYEADNEKWSVPGRLGYKIVFATWRKVTKQPDALLYELAATLGSA